MVPAAAEIEDRGKGEENKERAVFKNKKRE